MVVCSVKNVAYTVQHICSVEGLLYMYTHFHFIVFLTICLFILLV